jgi:hypothetical protein
MPYRRIPNVSQTLILTSRKEPHWCCINKAAIAEPISQRTFPLACVMLCRNIDPPNICGSAMLKASLAERDWADLIRFRRRSTTTHGCYPASIINSAYLNHEGSQISSRVKLYLFPNLNLRVATCVTAPIRRWRRFGPQLRLRAGLLVGVLGCMGDPAPPY